MKISKIVCGAVVAGATVFGATYAYGLYRKKKISHLGDDSEGDKNFYVVMNDDKNCKNALNNDIKTENLDKTSNNKGNCQNIENPDLVNGEEKIEISDNKEDVKQSIKVKPIVKTTDAHCDGE